MRIGFIGLGRMGASIALNLIKAGHALAVHDARRDAAALHLEHGARWAESPRLASQDAELVFTCLPGPAEVEAIALGENSIIDGAASGTVYADLSSGSQGDEAAGQRGQEGAGRDEDRDQRHVSR